jgi:tetratricopeptide (TPR) repeat protein
LAIQEEILGPEHFRVSATLANLASIYRRRAKFEAALELSRRAEQIARNALGDRHPLTCLRANKVAVLYGDTGRLSEAESLLRRTLEIQVRALGEDNPDVATTMANLAAICVRLKMTVEADSLYRRLLAILDRSRANDRKLVSVLGDFAWLLRQTGRSREAKKLESRAHEIAAMYPDDWRRYTVDVSDLLQAH